MRARYLTSVATVLATISGGLQPAVLAALADDKPNYSLLTNREIDEAFAAGLQMIDSERKWNSANQFTATFRFPAFAKMERVSALVVYLQSRGVAKKAVDQNREHYVWFEINYDQLRSWGYRGFRSGDVLRIVFTTESANSDKIMSFSAQLFGPTMP